LRRLCLTPACSSSSDGTMTDRRPPLKPTHGYSPVAGPTRGKGRS